MANQPDTELVIKHLLGRITFKSRTTNVETDIPVSEKISFRDLSDSIKEQQGFSCEYYKKTLELTLEDVNIELTKGFIILMINALDKTGSTTVIKDKIRKSRNEFKPDTDQGQGYEYSCHVVIKIDADNLGNHDILVEKVEGVTTNIFGLFINKVLFQIAKKYEPKYTCVMPLSNEKVRYKPVVEFFSKPDDDFIRSINNGKISDVILIREQVSDFRIPDTNVIVRPKEYSLKLDISEIKESHYDYLKKLGDFFSTRDESNSYNKIKIVYRDPDSAKGKGGSTAYLRTDTLLQDAKDTIVTKKYVLTDFTNPVKDSYETANAEISQKMINLISR